MIDYSKFGLIPSYSEFPVESIIVDDVTYEIPSEDILTPFEVTFKQSTNTYSKNTRKCLVTMVMIDPNAVCIDKIDGMMEIIGYDSVGLETERFFLKCTKKFLSGNTNFSSPSQKLGSNTYSIVANLTLYEANTGKRHVETFTYQKQLQ